MFPRFVRLFAILILLAGLLATAAHAAEIEMTDGKVYAGATIVRRDAANLEVYWQRGKIILPIFEVARIDGMRMSDIPETAYPYVSSVLPAAVATPTPLAPPTHLQPAPPVVPLASSPPRKIIRPTPTPAARSQLVAPIPTVAVPSQQSAVRQSNAVPAPDTPFPVAVASSETAAAGSRLLHGPFPWMGATLAVLGILWLASVAIVWRDGRKTPGRRAQIWLAVAIVLPAIGYVAYELTRFIDRWMRGRKVVIAHRREFIFLDADHRPIHIDAGEVASGLENAKDVLQDALLDRASDVHIEPGSTECRVRFRIDGILNPRMKFSAEEGLRLISALKTVAQLDIAERRKAQDGRFGGRENGRDVDFRVATTPSVYGEKLVLRVLDQKSGLRGLGELGMSDAMMKRFAEVINSRSGMILATGPTGSGKTSSLYAALSQLDAIRLNIVTIEDPVEYELAGATQIPVNVKAGVTYESGLRSILRQDPDVILVGEMRDLEAAQIALRSALTGHLVFTSLHTKDAIGTIHRLEEMGIERHLIASALFVVMAQRLVRVLCTACREAYPCTGKELLEIGIELPPGEAIYRGVGCRRCEGSGYVGRTGIFEMLILDEDLRQEINAGTAEDPFAKVARKKGYRGYREDGAEKVLLGITSVDEVLKAV